jgi:hypothetical protein
LLVEFAGCRTVRPLHGAQANLHGERGDQQVLAAAGHALDVDGWPDRKLLCRNANAVAAAANRYFPDTTHLMAGVLVSHCGHANQ